MTGHCKVWIPGKGFGFITGSDGVDRFVHTKNLHGGILEKGEEVEFDPIETAKGPAALNVRKTGGKQGARSAEERRPWFVEDEDRPRRKRHGRRRNFDEDPP